MLHGSHNHADSRGGCVAQDVHVDHEAHGAHDDHDARGVLGGCSDVHVHVHVHDVHGAQVVHGVHVHGYHGGHDVHGVDHVTQYDDA